MQERIQLLDDEKLNISRSSIVFSAQAVHKKFRKLDALASEIKFEGQSNGNQFLVETKKPVHIYVLGLVKKLLLK